MDGRRYKLTKLVNYLLEIYHKHYPRMALKALYCEELREETLRHIREYEDKLFEVLEKVTRKRRAVRETGKAKPRLILAVVALSLLGSLPLLHPFITSQLQPPRAVRGMAVYSSGSTAGHVTAWLHPAEMKERAAHAHFYETPEFHELLHALQRAAAFLPLLAFCLFFFWYKEQEKNDHTLLIKQRAHRIFLLVSVWGLCWGSVADHNAIPYLFSPGISPLGIAFVMSMSSSALRALYQHSVKKQEDFYDMMGALLLHLFEVQNQHYPRMSIKALDRKVDREESLRQMRNFNCDNAWIAYQMRRFIVGRKLIRAYADFKACKIDPWKEE